MIDLQKIAFLPLDIATSAVNFDELTEYHEKYSNIERTNMGNNTHGVYVFSISPIMYRGSVENFFDQQHYDTNFINRYNTSLGDPEYITAFNEKFPSIAKIIDQLPITLTHVELLSNKKDVPPHFDDWEIDGIVDPVWAILTTRTEEQKAQIPDWDIPLNSYKIFIYEDNVSSFYVCKDLLADPIYSSVDEQIYPVAITKLSYPHGATYVPSLRKFVISVWGIIDKDKHMALLHNSYNKHKDTAIIF